MTADNEKLVFATSGQGTWTSGTTIEMTRRGLEIICDANDPEWTKKVGDRCGVKLEAPVFDPFTGDNAVKVTPL